MASPAAAVINKSAFVHFSDGEGTRAKSAVPYGLPIVDDCATCKLRNSGFFCALSQPSTKSLDEMKHTSSYPEGAMVFMEGQAARGVYVVCQGRAKLMTTNSEGKTLILKIAQPGDVLGMHAVVSGKPYEITAETLQPCQLAFISANDFLRFLRENGEACLQAAQHISRDCHIAYESIRSIGLSHSVTEKMARLLLQWATDGRVEQMSIDEVSRILDLSESTVKVRLHRARRALRKAIMARTGAQVLSAFAFEAPRCDRVVARVFERISSMQRN